MLPYHDKNARYGLYNTCLYLDDIIISRIHAFFFSPIYGEICNGFGPVTTMGLLRSNRVPTLTSGSFPRNKRIPSGITTSLTRSCKCARTRHDPNGQNTTHAPEGTDTGSTGTAGSGKIVRWSNGHCSRPRCVVSISTARYSRGKVLCRARSAGHSRIVVDVEVMNNIST